MYQSHPRRVQAEKGAVMSGVQLRPEVFGVAMDDIYTVVVDGIYDYINLNATELPDRLLDSEALSKHPRKHYKYTIWLCLCTGTTFPFSGSWPTGAMRRYSILYFFPFHIRRPH